MGDELSPLANHGRPKKRERRRALMVEVCGVLWSLLENWKRLEFLKIWNSCGLWRKERNKEKGKRKRIYKREDIFSNLKLKISETQISGFRSRIRKTFRKIPKSSEI